MKLWEKIKRPLLGVVMFICLLLLLGCTGTVEHGGTDIGTYCIQGVVLLTVTIVSGIAGGFME